MEISSLPGGGCKELVGFCSAPWTDCITYADGALKACDRNVASFGNWQKLGLKKAWESEEFQQFRDHIRNGRYPDKDCASCHNNGTQRTAMSSLVGAFSVHFSTLKKHVAESHLADLAELHGLLYLKSRSQESDRILLRFFHVLDELERKNLELCASDPSFRTALIKLRVLGESLEDYLSGELKPRRVATFRQSQLQAKCTARCVMCAGLYTREIIDGPTLEEKYVDEAFAEMEDVTDFWCNGAEYMFYPDWKKIAKMLANEGVPARVSTNGILLTEQNIDFLLDNRILGFLTMSLDGAKKETMESTRVRVNFDKNMARIRYLLEKAKRLDHYFEFTAAFVMMKRNLRELPDFVRLIRKQMPEDYKGLVTVLCQPLENFVIQDYRRFVHEEHHALLDEVELRNIFLEAYAVAKDSGIQLSFYNQKIEEFVENGMKFPAFFPRPMDVELLLEKLERRMPFWSEEDADFSRWAKQANGNDLLLLSMVQDFVRTKLSSNGIVREIVKAFPEASAELEVRLPEYCAHFLNLYREKYRSALSEVSFGAYRALVFPIDPTDISTGHPVFCALAGGPTRVADVRGELVLLQNGLVLPKTHPELRGLAFLYLDGTEVPLPSISSGRWAMFIGRVCLGLNEWKNRRLGGIKSPFLWRLSRVYHYCLRAMGLRVLVLTNPRIDDSLPH